jgi:glyoxylase-like metal-dependent hydrolase (beta-lactamase superfamily II)
VLHLGWASTPGDVVVHHAPTGVAFAGGMVVSREVPSIRDSDFANWQVALRRLKALPIRTVVPGFGGTGGKELIDATLGYLQALDRKIRGLYEESSSLLQALESADLEAYRGWSGYEARHRQNVQHRYLQLEIEDLGGDPRSTAQPDR